MEQLSFEITAELRKLNKGLDKASAQIQSFSKRNEARLKKFGQSMTNVGQKMTVGLTAPLALLAGQSIRTFSTFDDQMRKVGVTAGATGKELDSLTDIAEELGATTRFSAREAASGLEFMALAGFSAEESIKAIPDVLNLAAAAAVDLGAASDIVTDTMSAFTIEAENASNVSDVFAATQSKANTSVLQLGEAFKLSAANANSFGADVETASAILGKLADAGIKGSRAGTTLNAIFRDIKDSADNNVLALNGQNIALADSEGNFRDILDILQDVETATGNLSESQRANALDAIFQQRSIRGVNTIMSQGVKETKSLRKELKGASGTAKSMADEMEGGLGGSLRSLKASFESLTIEIGDLLAPAMESIIKVAKNLINGFKSLDDSTKKIIVVVAGLAAALGPLLVVIGGIIQILPVIISGFAALTGPIGLTVGAIGLLIAGLVSLRSEFGETEKKLSTLNSIREEAAKSIAKEKSEVEVLLAVAKDENISKQRRIKAIKKLNKISPKYLGDLDLEKIKTDEAREAIEDYNKAIERRALVKAAEAKLKDLEAKKIERELAYQKKIEENKKEEIKLSKTSFDNAKAEEHQKEQLAAANEINKLAIENSNEEYEKEKSLILDIIKNNGDLEKSIESLNETRNKSTQGRPDVQSVGDPGRRPSVPRGELMPDITTDADLKLTGMENRLMEFAENANRIVNDHIVSAFVGLGEVIGNALSGSGNVLKNITQLVLGTMGSLLQQLGKQAIVLGLTLEGVKKALLSFGGLGAIAIGTVAVALGKAFSNKAASLGSNLGTSTSTGASTGGNGVNSSFSQSFSSSGTDEIILRARGRDLVAVLNAQDNFNNALG